MKPSLAIACIVAAGLIAGMVPHQLGFRPLPNVHDEFGYLLEADTFAHGRLTNPPHALPEYFQTIHQLIRPTYAAKFPPGQGLVLAVGQVIGDPIFGAFGTIALACGAVVWLIRAWLPLRWAIFGALLALVHPLIQFWAQTYWGGGVAMLGGAVLGGAVLRAARQPKTRYAIVAAAGLSILLISRPLEGTIFALLNGSYLLAGGLRQRRTLPDIGRFIGIGALCLLPVIFFTAYYNWRVTGAATQFPYALYAKLYQKPPLLFGQAINTHLAPLEPRVAQWRDGYEFLEYLDQSTPLGYLKATGNKVSNILRYWLDPAYVLALLLLPLPWLMRWRKHRWLLVLVLGLPVIQMIITPWMRMHYLAPAAGFYFLLLAAAARHLSRRRLGAALCLVILSYTAYSSGRLMYDQIVIGHPLGSTRQGYVDQLSQTPGDHVIVVSYTPVPQEIFEWVFNSADIDAQKVIWARDRGPRTLADLRTLYPDRQFWKLTVSGRTLDFRPLTPPNS